MADSDRPHGQDEGVSGPPGRGREVPQCHCHEEPNRGVAPLRMRNRVIVEVVLWIVRIFLDEYGTGG